MSLQASLLSGAVDVTGPWNSVPHKESGILTVESQSAGAHGKVKVLLKDRSAQG
jgi:hypothetical protein